MKPRVEIPPTTDEIFAAWNRAARAQNEWWDALAGLETAVGGIQLDMEMELTPLTDTEENREWVQGALEIAANNEVVD